MEWFHRVRSRTPRWVLVLLLLGAPCVLAEEPTGAEDAGAKPASASDTPDPVNRSSGVQEEEESLALELPDDEIPVDLRLATHQRMLTLIDEQRFEEARSAAERVLQLTREQFGDRHMELVAPLNNLAFTQIDTNQLAEAEKTYRRSIQLVTELEGFLSPRLVNPYVGLGIAYNRGEQFEQAREAFATALRLNHVNDGFYNPEQIKIRDGLTESHIGLGEIGDANFQQESQLSISRRRHGDRSLETLPAMYKLGRWYERSGQYEEAVSLFQSARRIAKAGYGAGSLELVDAYTGLAGAYESQGVLSSAAGALKKGLEIIDAQPEPDTVRRGQLLVKLGDIYMSNAKVNTAGSYYSDAWRTLSQSDPGLDERDRYFDSPTRISGIPLSRLRYARGAKRGAAGLKDGYLVVSFDVDSGGRARNIKIIEADPPGLLENRITRLIAGYWFRPRHTDGQPVLATSQLLTHEFKYLPADSKTPETKPSGRDTKDKRLELPGTASDG